MGSQSLDKPQIGAVLKEAERLFTNNNFRQADALYSRAVEVEPSNPSIYVNRSIVRTKLGEFGSALEDAEVAIELNANFGMGYYCKGIALHGMDNSYSSIQELSTALTKNHKNPEFVTCILNTALQSDLKDTLTPILSQLKSMQLENNAFIVVSVIGQELLSHGAVTTSIQVLENALKIGTRSLKLKGSVYSALSSALWSVGETDRAINYMQEDLSVARQLVDMAGECRAHGNLGAALFSQKKYQLARESHNRQLALAQRMSDQRSQLNAWSSIGHIQSAIGDHGGAIESHKHAASISEEIGDITSRCRELGLLGNCYLSSGDITSALQCQRERLRVAMSNQDGDCFKTEVAKAYADVANIHHKMERFEDEIACLQKSCEISQHLNNDSAESYTLASLGHIARQTGKLKIAKQSYERLLEVALTSGNQAQEAKACANLGVIHHQLGDYEMALKLQGRNLEIGEACRDLTSQGRAHGNIGNAYSAMGLYSQALQHHLKELEISQNVGDKASECSTHGNLAVAYQALNNEEKALNHYHLQMQLARSLGDTTNELRSYLNTANFYSTIKQFEQAAALYDSYLMLSTSLPHPSVEEMARVNYNLAFALFSCRKFDEAIKHYEANLELCKQLKDKPGMGRTYCNLGLAWKESGNLERSLECQNMFLEISHETQSAKGTFKALGNIGDIYLSNNAFEEAETMYRQQFDLASTQDDLGLIAQSCSMLGNVYRLIGDYQKSLDHHTKELEIYNKTGSSKNLVKVHNRIGDIYSMIGRFQEALKHYKKQYELCHGNDDVKGQTSALWNLGVTEVSLGNHINAIEHFESQITMLDSDLEKGAVLCAIGECKEKLTNHKGAKQCYNDCLKIAVNCDDELLQEKAYRGLTSIVQINRDLNRAIWYGSKRVDVCKSIDDASLTVAAQLDLASLYNTGSNYMQALECVNYVIGLMGDMELDQEVKGEALRMAGQLNCKLHKFNSALDCYKLELNEAMESGDLPNQGRIHGDLGQIYSTLSRHSMAITHFEQQLFVAEKSGDAGAKCKALVAIAMSLSRQQIEHKRAMLLLQQASIIAKQNNDKIIENQITLEHGMAMWASGDLNQCESLLVHATEEAIDCLKTIGVKDEKFMAAYAMVTKCHASLLAFFIATEQHSRALGVLERSKHIPQFILESRNLTPISDIEITTDSMIEKSVRDEVVIFYTTVVSGCLVSWLITPIEGLCAFNNQSVQSDGRNTILSLLSELRDSLGLEDTSSSNDLQTLALQGQGQLLANITAMQSTLGHDLGLHDILVGGANANNESKSKSPIYTLFQRFIGPFEPHLKNYQKNKKFPLLFIIDSELSLIPFSLLKKRPNDKYLSELFIIQTRNSFEPTKGSKLTNVPPNVLHRGVVVGNPIMSDHTMSSQAEEECNLVSAMLQVEPLVGSNAQKDNVLTKIQGSEVIHISCPIGWGEILNIKFGVKADDEKVEINNVDNEEGNNKAELSNDNDIDSFDCLLTMDEIMELELTETKLVVIGSPYLHNISLTMDERGDNTILSFIISNLTIGLLSRGVKSVLFPLWPVPVIASKLLMHTFYKTLCEGEPTSIALDKAVDNLRSTERFQHPSFWAGFVLVGQDVTLEPSNLAMTHALAVLVESDPGHLHDTLRLVIHLIDKSLQRMHAPEVDHSIPMYTTQSSIAKKVREVIGWRELLSASRFKLRPSINNLPDAVFFPGLEDEEFLLTLKPVLITFLQLSVPSLIAVNRLFNSPLAASRLIQALEATVWQEAMDQLDLEVTRKTWQTDGTDDLLVTLGFNVSEIEEFKVHLSCMVEDNTITDIKNVLQVLKIFFGSVGVETKFDHGRNLSRDFTDAGQEHVADGSNHLVGTNHSLQKDESEVLVNPTLNKTNTQISADQPNSRRSIVDDLTSAFQSLAHPLDGVREEEDLLFEPKEFTSEVTANNIVVPKPVFPNNIPRKQQSTQSSNQPNETVTPQKKKMFYVVDSDINEKVNAGLEMNSVSKIRSKSFSFLTDDRDDFSPRKVRTVMHDRTQSETKPWELSKRHYTPSPSVARSLSMHVTGARDYRQIVDKFDHIPPQHVKSRSFEGEINNNGSSRGNILPQNLTPNFFTNQYLSQIQQVHQSLDVNQQPSTSQHQQPQQQKDIPPDVYYTNGEQIQITKSRQQGGNTIIRPVPIKPASTFMPIHVRPLVPADKLDNAKERTDIRPTDIAHRVPSNGHVEFV